MKTEYADSFNWGNKLYEPSLTLLPDKISDYLWQCQFGSQAPILTLLLILIGISGSVD